MPQLCFTSDEQFVVVSTKFMVLVNSLALIDLPPHKHRHWVTVTSCKPGNTYLQNRYKIGSVS